jgi:hypothetical protein
MNSRHRAPANGVGRPPGPRHLICLLSIALSVTACTSDRIPSRGLGEGGRDRGSPSSHGGGGPPWAAMIPIVAITGLALLDQILTRTPDTDLAKDLKEHGPQLPTRFSLSAFNVVGFVNGGWPMAIAYQSERATQVSIKVTAVFAFLLAALDAALLNWAWKVLINRGES